VEEGLLLDEPGPAEAPGVEGYRRYQGKESLAGGQGTFIGEMHEFLAAVCREGGPGLVPLSHPFALGRGLRGHTFPPGPIRLSNAFIIYDPWPFINPLIRVLNGEPGADRHVVAGKGVGASVYERSKVLNRLMPRPLERLWIGGGAD